MASTSATHCSGTASGTLGAVARVDGFARERGNEYTWRCAGMAMLSLYGTSLGCDTATVVM